MNWHGGVQTTDSGFITVPLPPSTNARLGVSRGGFKYTTPKCKKWMSETERGLIEAFGNLAPISEYIYLDIWMVLPRSNADCSNYLKVPLDSMQNAGLVTDDKYIVPRIQGVGHDAKNPSIVMRFVR